jgi:hypothetical protein
MKPLLLLLLAVVLVHGQSQTINPCEVGPGCCFTIDFESTPGDPQIGDSVNLAQGYEVLQDTSSSPWAEEMGIQFTLDNSNVRPGTLWKYPIALLNASALPNTLSSPGKNVYSATDGLVLTAVDQLSPTLVPLMGSWTLHVYSLLRPICMEHIRVLRSFAWTNRMTQTTITLYDATGNILDSQQFTWGLSVQQPAIDIDYTVSGVVHIKLDFVSTQGYGALSYFRGCFGNAEIDSCGVCGGNNLCLPTIQAGDPCVVPNTTNPSCQLGHQLVNQTTGLLQCISDLTITGVEICNGVDDNCNGLIDENQPVVECGVGACFRQVSSCVNGQPNACVPGTPTPEICNGVDDNCNGLVDEGGVCESNNSQPLIAELLVTPQLACVRALTVSSCLAKFGYVNQNANSNYTFLLDGLHNALFYPLGDGVASPMAVPVTWGSVPTFFAPGASVQVAFEASYPCNGSVTWRLGDGAGRFIGATAAGTAALCQSDVAPWLVTRQISPTVDSPCVLHDAANQTCSALFGYYNPNSQSVRIMFSSVDNSFFFSGTALSLAVPAQPQTFLSGRNRQMLNATWPCASGSLEWHLQGRTAQANLDNMC